MAARDAQPAIRSARFWLPLTVVLTGARSPDVMGLRVNDIECLDGRWILQLPESFRPRSMCVSSPGRWVPVHDELIRCGFLAHAARRKLEGHVYLFASEYETRSLTATLASVNRWLARLARSLNLPLEWPLLAALRYNFIEACVDSGPSGDVAAHLTGLRGLSWTSQSFWQSDMPSPALPRHSALMSHVQFEGHGLSHLHVSDPFENVDAAFRAVATP